jgi:hypothetical protein
MEEKPLVTMSKIGRWGRFANQIFQYAFLRLYAKKNNFRFQTASWIGQYLFGVSDPPITVKLSLMNDGPVGKVYDGHTSKIAGAQNPPVNVDLIGYFQYQTSFYAPHKEFFRSLFVPTPEVQAIVHKAEYILRLRGNTIIGIHLRRGDYGTFKKRGSRCFFIAPCEWYLDWLEENWGRWDNPVLFIASDEMNKVKSAFKKYNPVTNDDLGVVMPKAPYYPDFYMLSRCDVIATSNSSFSFAASMLNKNCREFYRPRLSLKKLIPYDPWNAHTIFRDEEY